MTSNSRHGTHSPFVYALADELIYNKSVKRSNSLMEDIITYYGQKGVDTKSFLTIDLEECNVEELADLQNEYYMIFVEHIHHGQSERKWKQMQKDTRFIVLIDLFHFGIICKRKEQHKDTFKLRYPFWFY